MGAMLRPSTVKPGARRMTALAVREPMSTPAAINVRLPGQRDDCPLLGCVLRLYLTPETDAARMDRITEEIGHRKVYPAAGQLRNSRATDGRPAMGQLDKCAHSVYNNAGISMR